MTVPPLPRWLAALGLVSLAYGTNVVINRYLAEGESADAVLTGVVAVLLSVPLISALLGRGEPPDDRPPSPPAFGT